VLSTRVGRAEWVPLRMAYCRLEQGGALRRPLTAAVAAAGRGRFVLDGVARMRERPIQDLVDGLVQLGVQASCSLGTGCPPVEVLAEGLPSGTVRRCSLPSSVTTAAGWSHFTPACLGSCHMQPASLLCPAPIMRSCLALVSMHDTVHSWAASWELIAARAVLDSQARPPSSAALCVMQVELSGSVSSQYLTALLMAAPLATGEAGVDIRITDELVSQPYVDMTVRLMERFGVKVGAPRCCFKAQAVPSAVCSCKQQTLPALLKLGMQPLSAWMV